MWGWCLGEVRFQMCNCVSGIAFHIELQTQHFYIYLLPSGCKHLFIDSFCKSTENLQYVRHSFGTGDGGNMRDNGLVVMQIIFKIK